MKVEDQGPCALHSCNAGIIGGHTDADAVASVRKDVNANGFAGNLGTVVTKGLFAYAHADSRADIELSVNLCICKDRHATPGDIRHPEPEVGAAKECADGFGILCLDLVAAVVIHLCVWETCLDHDIPPLHANS